MRRGIGDGAGEGSVDPAEHDIDADENQGDQADEGRPGHFHRAVIKIAQRVRAADLEGLEAAKVDALPVGTFEGRHAPSMQRSPGRSGTGRGRVDDVGDVSEHAG